MYRICHILFGIFILQWGLIMNIYKSTNGFKRYECSAEQEKTIYKSEQHGSESIENK